MIALVSFIGWIVVRYSMRQLDGDPDSAAYYRHFAWTLGGISLAVIAGNLLLMFATWLLANFGLRRLLRHDRRHSGAAEGARMKLAVDRLGMVLLAAALIFIGQHDGTWNLAQLLQFRVSQPTAAAPNELATVIAWLLVLASTVISVQFPFCFWMPQTLATPTPVSALMHAGIINAGGYFLIRLNALLIPAPAALTALAAVGTVTLLLGGLARRVLRSLAT
jgi:NAD(P)H-quinone oxidoreductase subunit 5